MENISRSFRNYLRSLKDIYESFKKSSPEERIEFFKRIEGSIPFPFYEEYEYFCSKYYKRGYFPFPFFFFPPNPKYWDLLEDEWQFPFKEVLKELEREFEVGDNKNQEFSPGEKQISRDVQFLSDQFMQFSKETSTKLDEPPFRIISLKDNPRNVVGHIDENGIFKFVVDESGLKKEWEIANLTENKKSLKETINHLIITNPDNKAGFIKKLKEIIDGDKTI